MSDDLTQRLRQYLNSKYEVTMCYNGLRDEAADRIEELEDRNKKLTLQLLATSGHDRREAKDRIEAVEREWEWWRNECQKFREAWVQEKSKLAKAVGALRCYADGLRNAGLARAVLVELEGGE
jgi:hypothetical protein